MAKRFLNIFMVCGFLAMPSPALAESCSLDGIKLNCGDGNSASILAAMASPETANVLNDPLSAIGKFQKPSDLEIFRRSVEANWRRVNRAERTERAKMRRRQISAAEFGEWSKSYNAARENYNAAMTLYRNLVWFGKNGKPAPEG